MIFWSAVFSLSVLVMVVDAQCPAGQYAISQTSCAFCSKGYYCPGDPSGRMECPSGKFNPDTGKSSISACQSCAIGYFASSKASVVCTICPTGTFASNTATVQCTNCAAGTYNPNTGSSSSGACVACSPGQYSDAGSASCLACSMGQYQPSAASSSCLDCGRGTFAANTGMTACSVCRAGTYNPALGSSSVLSCVACEAGTYSKPGSTDESDCRPCEVGTYSPYPGAASCTVTAPGTFTNLSGAATFLLCPPGQYAPGYNNTRCTNCPAGTTSSMEGSASCTSSLTCTAGTYVALSGDRCIACPPGQYSSTTNARSCVLCPAGSYNPSEGSTSSAACIKCAAGTFSEEDGASSATVCLACPAGTYNSGVGSSTSSACRPCPAGRYGPTTGATNVSQCLTCAHGTFASLTGAVECEPCAAGSYSSVSGAASSTSCSLCPAGTYSNQTGATTLAACALCVVGSYNPARGATVCLLCESGYYADRLGSAVCVPCPLGTFSGEIGLRSASLCTPCPTGTYALNPAATSNATCMACAPGQYSSTTAATSFTACQQCPSGTFSETSGAALCTPCPEGTSGRLIGAKRASDCERCGIGTYADLPGQSMCSPCPAGWFQNETGQHHCTPCPKGTATSRLSSSSCQLCGPGTFAAEEGTTHCNACPAGTLQLVAGGVRCDDCPVEYTELPLPLGGSAGSSGGVEEVPPLLMESDVCRSFQRSVVMNWGPVESPALLGANVTVVADTVPPWLTVAVKGGSTLLSLSSDLIPPSAVRHSSLGGGGGAGVWNVTVVVAQTCRAHPLQSVVALQLYRASPVLVRRVEAVEACPNFVAVYSLSLGTCAAQTTVTAQLRNGSALPPSMTVASDANTVEIAGSFPEGWWDPLDIVVVAWLGQESFVSLPTTIRLAATQTIEVTTESTSVVRACPFVSILFTVTRSSRCGRLRTRVLQENGELLPSFLIVTASSAAGGEQQLSSGDDKVLTITVYGTVPAGYATLRLVAAASTGGGGEWFSSRIVEVVRPELTSSANVTAEIDSNDAYGNDDGNYSRRTAGGNDSISVSSPSPTTVAARQVAYSSSLSVPLALSVTYGAPTRVTLTIDAGPGGLGSLCSSLALALSRSAPSAGGVANVPGQPLPSWVGVSSTSSVTVVLSILPPATVPLGTNLSLFAWANDGLRNPGFELQILVESSLKFRNAIDLNATNRSGSSSSVPVVTTPASLLEMKVALMSSSEASPTPTTAAAATLICPNAAAGAFCSFSADAATLGAFGTPAGINAVLQGMRYAVSGSDETTVNQTFMILTFSESVNPEALTVTLPLHSVPRYIGVSQAALPRESFVATVGKPLLIPLLPYATATSPTPLTSTTSSAAAIVFRLTAVRSLVVVDGGAAAATSTTPAADASVDWITIQDDHLVGTPLVAQLVSFTISISDLYTAVSSTGLLNVSIPMSPRVQALPALQHWTVVSNSQLDIQLPSSIIVDPENGTLSFELRTDDGTLNGQPLPLFLTFDARSFQLTGTPSPSHVGSYSLMLIGRSRWGSWQGQAAVPLTITVEESWSDFFARVYEYVGYGGTLFAVLTWCFVQRALLLNMALFPRRLRPLTPISLCTTGRYVIGSWRTYPPSDTDPLNSTEQGPSSSSAQQSNERTEQEEDGGSPSSLSAVDATQVKEVRVVYLAHPPPQPMRWYHNQYLTMQERCSRVPLKTHFVGVGWISARSTTTTPFPTVELTVDVEALQRLVAEGDCAPSDEYYVEVLRGGMWMAGTVIEAFTFRLQDLHHLDCGMQTEEAEIDFCLDDGESTEKSAVSSRVRTPLTLRGLEKLVEAQAQEIAALREAQRGLLSPFPQRKSKPSSSRAHTRQPRQPPEGRPVNPLTDPYLNQRTFCTDAAYMQNVNHRHSSPPPSEGARVQALECDQLEPCNHDEDDQEQEVVEDEEVHLDHLLGSRRKADPEQQEDALLDGVEVEI